MSDLKEKNEPEKEEKKEPEKEREYGESPVNLDDWFLAHTIHEVAYRYSLK